MAARFLSPDRFLELLHFAHPSVRWISLDLIGFRPFYCVNVFVDRFLPGRDRHVGKRGSFMALLECRALFAAQ